MIPVLVDSDILIDIATDAPRRGEGAMRALIALGRGARLIVNPPIHAELSMALARIETLEALLPEDLFYREALPWAAAFLAGKAFLVYQERGGTRSSPWPVFHIGAHAAIRGYRLLTRDPALYRACFPTLKAISPDD